MSQDETGSRLFLQHYYMDVVQAPTWFEPGAAWAGVSTPEACYEYEPAQGLTPGKEHRPEDVQE